ncbi:hypothetical protein GCM10027199_78820 [Amycolatopsis magusensis]
MCGALAFAADASSFGALGCEDIGMAGVGVAPPQVTVQGAGRDGVIGVVRPGDRERLQGVKCALIGLAEEQ